MANLHKSRTHRCLYAVEADALRARVAELEEEVATKTFQVQAWLTEETAWIERHRELYRYRAALEELACLGNGDQPGNSVGNLIAQRALKP